MVAPAVLREGHLLRHVPAASGAEPAGERQAEPGDQCGAARRLAQRGQQQLLLRAAEHLGAAEAAHHQRALARGAVAVEVERLTEMPGLHCALPAVDAAPTRTPRTTRA